MTPGADGSGLTVTVNGAEAVPVPQALVPATVIVPFVAVAEKSTVIIFVFTPLTMLAPVGKVHA